MMTRRALATVSIAVACILPLALTSTAFAVSLYPSTVAANPSLVGYWRMNELGAQTDAQGTTMADATGAHPGVYHLGVDLGAPGALEGDTGTSAHFGSPDGYADIPFSSSLNPAVFSLEAWVRLDTPSNYMDIVSNGAQYSDTTGYLLETFPDYSKVGIAAVFGSGSSAVLLKGVDFMPGLWYDVVLTYDGTTARMYVNGQQTSSVTTAYSPNVSYPLRVASSTVLSGSGQLQGSVDELALYNSALTSATILQHYQLGIDDGTSPQTEIDSGPSGLTNQTNATIAFSSGSVTPTFQCRLDGGSWTPCVSPDTISGLANGPHQLSVRATNRAGRADPSPPSADWTVDTTAPMATFSSGPPSASMSTQAAFAFSSSKPGSTFSCQLDARTAAPCSSPYSLGSLTDGPHTLTLFSTDGIGNVSSPVSYNWSVDTAPPSAFISQGPTLANPNLPFVFSANEPGVSFRCQVDGGSYQACASPFVNFPLSIGTHSLSLEASDGVGMVDPNGPIYVWTVLAPSRASALAPSPQRAGQLQLTFPRRLLTSAAVRRQERRLDRRCHHRRKCLIQVRRSLIPMITWHSNEKGRVSIIVFDGRGRRVASSGISLKSGKGQAPVPARLVRQITSRGRHRVVLTISAHGRRSVRVTQRPTVVR
jgi:hypothetical protein